MPTPRNTIALTREGQSPRGSAADALAGIGPAPRSLYVHIPFCFHKCHYCDFYSFVDSRDQQAAFTDALGAELRFLGAFAERIDTVFVGGGTPSLLRVDLWDRVVAALHASFRLAPGAEFTVECNPETVTPELMRTLRAGGVTRVSMGAQSFDTRHLKTLERWHDPASVARALDLAAEAGIARRSIDLIYAIPGQTMDDWQRDLERALTLPIEHISCYALTYEPNTPMTVRMERGEFEAAEDDVETAMNERTVAMARGAGFHRYEVSNFARGEHARCAHNMVYWRSGEWLAAGPSASAHVAGHRWKNVPRLGDWMAGVHASGGASPIVDHEPPDARRALAERIMMGIRTDEGLDWADIGARAAALDRAEQVERALAGVIERGWAARAEKRVRLTDPGYHFADGVASTLIAALRR
jgi:oxygen-independent coproporphyrinogen-3 oxidase